MHLIQYTFKVSIIYYFNYKLVQLLVIFFNFSRLGEKF